MNSAAFSAASGKIAPERWAGWLATIPTGRPSIRAKAVTISLPYSGLSSNTDSASTTRSIRSVTSYARFGSSGITASVPRGSSAGGDGSARGGSSPAISGRYEISSATN